MSARMTSKHIELVAEQARKVRLLYPELFDALAARDRQLRSALSQIPHPDDPESFVPAHVWQQSIRQLLGLDQGISDLARNRR